ncbi:MULTISPECIES: hypothetical protein [Micrococcaceae]|uniref:hypothetical protein n=1 Tax=Micrococcaceae TaxID=1268 RepID=UPI00105CEBF3|nr:hypothetical protein [Arthrobacter sp. JUb115]TDU22404.1 hypothetical protein EDF61_11094 [Arthrobacter sp. JUb115]
MQENTNEKPDLASQQEAELGIADPSATQSGPEADETLASMLKDQNLDAEQFATVFLKKVIRLRGVKIDREHFLTAELHKRGLSREQIERAVSTNPAAAGIGPEILDDIASNSIDFETRKSTALSFASGLPGGLFMFGTIPADITQFYIHAFRVMQKIAYTYGWQSFLDDVEHIDDETLGKLAGFLGVMMGVSGASTTVGRFASQVAGPAIQKNLAKQALTKTAWYGPMKQTLRLIGVNVTKQSFAKSVSKIVPVVGGVVSGGLTFVTLKVQSSRLKQHLRELPPPLVDAAEYLAALHDLDAAEAEHGLSTTLTSAGASALGKAQKVAGSVRDSNLVKGSLSGASAGVSKAKNLGSSLAGAASGRMAGLKRAERHRALPAATTGDQPETDDC